MEDSRALEIQVATTEPTPEAALMAHAGGLVYVCDSDPGIGRVRKAIASRTCARTIAG